MTLIASVFRKVESVKDLQDQCLKNTISGHSSTVKMLKGGKRL